MQNVLAVQKFNFVQVKNIPRPKNKKPVIFLVSQPDENIDTSASAVAMHQGQ